MSQAKKPGLDALPVSPRVLAFGVGGLVIVIALVIVLLNVFGGGTNADAGQAGASSPAGLTGANNDTPTGSGLPPSTFGGSDSATVGPAEPQGPANSGTPGSTVGPAGVSGDIPGAPDLIGRGTAGPGSVTTSGEPGTAGLPETSGTGGQPPTVPAGVVDSRGRIDYERMHNSGLESGEIARPSGPNLGSGTR